MSLTGVVKDEGHQEIDASTGSLSSSTLMGLLLSLVSRQEEEMSPQKSHAFPLNPLPPFPSLLPAPSILIGTAWLYCTRSLGSCQLRRELRRLLSLI